MAGFRQPRGFIDELPPYAAPSAADSPTGQGNLSPLRLGIILIKRAGEQTLLTNTPVKLLGVSVLNSVTTTDNWDPGVGRSRRPNLQFRLAIYKTPRDRLRRAYSGVVAL